MAPLDLIAPTGPRDWLIVLPLLLPLVGAAILLMVRRLPGLPAGFAMAVCLAMLACEGGLFAHVAAEGPVAMTMGNWPAPFGISFAVDMLGAGFAILAAALTLVVLVYTQMDRSPRDDGDGLYVLVLLLLAGVTGAFLTGDLFNLYVWFEVMLIASFGLMVLGGHPIQLDAAIKYGVLNFIGTTIFLVALGLVYGALGTLNMADIAMRAAAAEPGQLAVIGALLLLAFATKAAAFPVNAWLAAGYHAPPPALSALLAGLLTKVGLYALLRVLVALLPLAREELEPVILALALTTMLLGPMGAIAETNLRRALGFLVIGGVGAALAGLALPSPDGLAGAVLYGAHAMATMTALYLLAGLVEKRTGALDTRQMGGLYGCGSWLSILFFLMILSVAGVPPALGFWPKLLLVTAAADTMLQPDWGAVALLVGLLLNAILTLIAGTRLWAHMFWRESAEGPLSEQPNAALRPLSRREIGFGLLPAGLLALAVTLAGLMPDAFIATAQQAARGLLDPRPYIAAVAPEVLP